MDSKNLIIANWKLNKLREEVVNFVQNMPNVLKLGETVGVGIAPPLTSLGTLHRMLQDTPIAVGAQNTHWKDSGAHTGEVSAPMLKDAGVEFVIIGHSERRSDNNESNDVIKLKVDSVLKNGLQAILCIGESLEEYEQGKTEEVIKNQLVECLPEGSEDLLSLVIAYEPVWAIGSGKMPTPEEIQKVHKFIRKTLINFYDSDHRIELIPILYGGSVKPENIEVLMAQEDVNGALVGGASLDAESFFSIVSGAEKAVAKKH